MIRSFPASVTILGSLILALSAIAREPMPRASDPALAKYEGDVAPQPKGLVLQKGDRLAICGDSITEQKMYSRIVETYLTVCVPDLGITCRQYGWSGEKADGFLRRMKQDVLRFSPTVATTCYGMNDHRYVPYTEEIGKTYRENMQGVARAFKEAGVRVILGSPGTIGTMPHWVKSATGTAEDLNLSLLELRDIGIGVAEQEGTGFADIYWPMLVAGEEAQHRYGEDFMLYGKDGVHPGWAGQAVMASAFLFAMGLDGDLGGITVDLATGKADGRGGHEASDAGEGKVKVRSTRYPFCPGQGDIGRDDNMRAGFALVPFMEKLNRFTLIVKNAPVKGCKVTWGKESRVYHREELERGVNLGTWVDNPFTPAFQSVMEAVLAKQNYETKQIKSIFHGEEGRKDIEAAATRTEAERAPLAEAIRRAFVPVEHELRVEGVN